jgi:hypothetical protein
LGRGGIFGLGVQGAMVVGAGNRFGLVMESKIGLMFEVLIEIELSQETKLL